MTSPSGAQHPFAAGQLPASSDPLAASAAAYATEVAELLYALLLDVLRGREPAIVAALAGQPLPAGTTTATLEALLRAQGIWFQLLSIAEQNAAMRRRRQTESERGAEQVRGTFAQVLADAVRDGIPAAEMRDLLGRLRIRPVLTAHPTEAKRVTVLERHRRIYRRLVDLESPRWTPRERGALVDQLRNEIELLWMTGELRLETPDRAAGGLLGAPLLQRDPVRGGARAAGKARPRAAAGWPGESFEVRPSSSSAPGSAATATATRTSPTRSPAAPCAENRKASLERYRGGSFELLQSLSITERASTIRRDFRAALERELGARGSRSPAGIPVRCTGSSLPVMIRLEGARTLNRGAPRAEGYGTAEDLMADLRRIEQALSRDGSRTSRPGLVRPLLREVESFRFSTVRLDLRENSARINAALGPFWPMRRKAASRRASRLDRVERLAAGRAGPAAAGTRRSASCRPMSPRSSGMFRLVTGDAGRTSIGTPSAASCSA